MSLAQRARLASLLLRFNLSHAPRADAAVQGGNLVADLKAEYLRLAKECHPDRAPDERKREAAEGFMQLQQEFEEAMKLLEAGVRPSAWNYGPESSTYSAPVGAQRWTPTSSGVEFTAPRYEPPPWSELHRPYREQPKQEEFSLMTRIKGHMALWGGLFIFFSALREFLVWSAGSTFAWQPPANLNPFWIRRFDDKWSEAPKEHRKSLEEMAPIKRKMSMQPTTIDRGVDDFYKKRGVSNVRRDYQPRGCGGASL